MTAQDIALRQRRQANATEVPRVTPEYVEALGRTARKLKEASRAPSTVRAYTTAWGQFSRWCEVLGLEPLPASETTVIAYVAHLDNAGVSHSTVSRHVAAIKWMHQRQGQPLQTSSLLSDVTEGHAREHRDDPKTRATGITVEQLRQILAPLDPTDPRDVRDRAILLVGFATGMRRSELVALTRADIEDHPDGLRLLVRHSKTDQRGAGSYRALPFGASAETCPVAALRAWLAISGPSTGRVFRAVHATGSVWGQGLRSQAVADIVRDRAQGAGLTGEDARWSGHSLRRGFATTAARNGASRAQIMEDGGWTSNAVDSYIDAGKTFKDRAASCLGL